MRIGLLLLAFMNVITWGTYGIDKWQAKTKGYRISEKMLMSLTFLGGSLGALLGMRMFRHKTRKAKFCIGVPICLVLHIGIVVFLLMR